MARNDLVSMFVAAGAAALVAISTPAYAADQEGVAREASEQSASQGIGGTSGAAMDRSAQSWADSHMSDFRGPHESTFLSPYEVRTPAARDNIDD
jgi:hypothetical protein